MSGRRRWIAVQRVAKAFMDSGYVAGEGVAFDLAEQAVDEIAAWLVAEAGRDGDHGSVPALRVAADHLGAQR